MSRKITRQTPKTSRKMAGNSPENHPTVLEIKRILANETEHWRIETMRWWRQYLRNRVVITKLRCQNRALRLLLSDYIEKD